jgi:peptide/nickel transport system permease protein
VIRKYFHKLQKRSPVLSRKRWRRWPEFWKRFLMRELNIAATIFLFFIGFVALGAGLLASNRPLAYSVDGEIRILPGRLSDPIPGMETNESALDTIKGRADDWVLLSPVPFAPNQAKVNGQILRLSPPGDRHLLGTDDKGRDVASRMIHASRSALMVGLGSVALYLVFAILIGAVAGYFGGLADRVALRIIETLTSFPTFFLILAIQGIIGATGFWQLILVIGITRWTDVARLTRAEVLRVVNEEYILAARAIGLTHFRIMVRHVLPAAIGPALVAATTGVADAILIESTLSFLGFGVPSNIPSWGQLLTDAFYNEGAYWLALFPGTLLFLTLVSINLTGEGLREAMDPVEI